MARIDMNWIKAQVVAEQYHEFPGTMMTVCCLTLRNGFNTVGTAACADPKIFNVEVGHKFAYEDALNKIWPLEGYLLKEKLSSGSDVDDYPT